MINKEFFAALEQLEKEKGIPVDYMLDRVGQALITAYKRDNDGMTDNVYVVPDRDKQEIRMFVRKTVVDDVYEPYEELSVEEAMLQMNLIGHQFYFFRNADEGNVYSVLYKRANGGYGLIEGE